MGTTNCKDSIATVLGLIAWYQSVYPPYLLTSSPIGLARYMRSTATTGPGGPVMAATTRPGGPAMAATTRQGPATVAVAMLGPPDKLR